MELLSPAGSPEKLEYAYAFGADAAYMGFDGFSLRAKADNFPLESAEAVKRLKGNRKLYCALNIYCRDSDIARLEEKADEIAAFPFDAFIISDMGLLPFMRRRFPGVELHLSTQANCLNAEAAKFYRDQGFSRVIPAREMTLKELAAMKNAVPDLELEVFVHGAICLAYSGRCFLSAWMTGRSSNDGNCAHSCRWEYRVLEEKMRPGQYYPIQEGNHFTTILSSRDLCMIDHLDDLREAGMDALKIEGRMKSVYYTAAVTRAYRTALDRLSGIEVPEGEWEDARSELFAVSHREYSTGFFYGLADIEMPAIEKGSPEATFLGTVEARLSPGIFLLDVANRFVSGTPFKAIGPDAPGLRVKDYRLSGEYGETLAQGDHGKKTVMTTDAPLGKGYILRALA